MDKKTQKAGSALAKLMPKAFDALSATDVAQEALVEIEAEAAEVQQRLDAQATGNTAVKDDFTKEKARADQLEQELAKVKGERDQAKTELATMTTERNTFKAHYDNAVAKGKALPDEDATTKQEAKALPADSPMGVALSHWQQKNGK